MSDIHAKQIDDLVTTTLDKLGRGRIIQIAQTQPKYEVYSKWFKKDKVTFSGGTGITQTLATKLPGSARHVGMYSQDSLQVVNLLKTMSVPWIHATANWGYELREMMMNKGMERINNIIVPRRELTVINLIEVLENKAWSAPSVDNTLDPYGIAYWLVVNSTKGFNGGLPSDHTTVGGVNLTNTPQFKNYTGTYSEVSKTDLIELMLQGHYETDWMSPTNVQEFRGFQGKNYRWYTNYTTYRGIVTAAEGTNDNLGPDVAGMDGMVVVKRHPIVPVKYLDNNDTTGLVYGVNHETFHPVVLAGDYLRETPPKEVPGNHNARAVHIDITYNYVCLDRRRNMVFYQA